MSLGYRALALVTTPPDMADLVQLADASLTRVRDDLGETSHFATLDGSEILYLASRYSDHALDVRHPVGRRLPAQLTALGKAMLATLEEDALATAMPTQYPTPTDTSIPDEPTLRTHLADVRARGYADDRGESTVGVFLFGGCRRPPRSAAMRVELLGARRANGRGPGPDDRAAS